MADGAVVDDSKCRAMPPHGHSNFDGMTALTFVKADGRFNEARFARNLLGSLAA